jgi:maltose-binding protein MalE
MGENEEAGGFLDVEGMVVNRHTESFGGSLDLMEYLTNAPSQGRIARSGVGRIPINGAVSIDPTISPIEAALVAQQRRAVLLPADVQHHRAELRSVANDVYLQVTRGLLEPAAAVDALADGYDEATEVDGG